MSPTSVSAAIGRGLFISTFSFEDRSSLPPAGRGTHYTRRVARRPYVEDIERGGAEGDRLPRLVPDLRGAYRDRLPHPDHRTARRDHASGDGLQQIDLVLHRRHPGGERQD